MLLQSFHSGPVSFALFSFHKADPYSVLSVVKCNFKMFGFQNSLFAICSSLLKAILRPPA